MDDFDRALTFTLRWEGGRVDDPADRGGRLSASTNARDWTHGTPWSIATEMKHVGMAHETIPDGGIGSLVTEIDQFTVQSF